MIQSNPTAFVTAVSRPEQFEQAHLMIESLRSFGGSLADSPVWIMTAADTPATVAALGDVADEVSPLSIPTSLRHVWFASKVSACAQAEQLAHGQGIRTLVWLATDCLIIQPPVDFALRESADAAVRQVHHRNIGLLANEPVDAFWQRVYGACGVDNLSMTVTTFVDQDVLRAYFNSHVLALNPNLGLCRRWLTIFEDLATDPSFQSGPCHDVPHRIFLHQAVLSTLLASKLGAARIRLLPPTYSYPYNLQAEIPAARRANTLNDLVCIAYEDRTLNPDVVDDIAIRDPLRAWLVERLKERLNQ